MAIRTKSEIAAFFESGDKPTQAQFADFIDSCVFIPTAGATGIVEVESAASATMRSLGALGTILVGAGTTASAVGHLGVPNDFSTVGKALASAATTAAVRSILNLTSVPSNPDIIVLTGQIEAPVTGNYVLDQRAAFAYDVEWIAAQSVSGHSVLTAQIDGVNITGIVSATVDTSEVAASAAANRSVAVGQTLRLVATGVSGGGKLSFSLKGVRT